MAAGAHAPSAAARLRKKGGNSATETVMRKGSIVFLVIWPWTEEM